METLQELFNCLKEVENWIALAENSNSFIYMPSTQERPSSIRFFHGNIKLEETETQEKILKDKSQREKESQRRLLDKFEEIKRDSLRKALKIAKSQRDFIKNKIKETL